MQENLARRGDEENAWIFADDFLNILPHFLMRDDEERLHTPVSTG